eukprot:3970221-Pyramimonas_sp.AAC.1
MADDDEEAPPPCTWKKEREKKFNEDGEEEEPDEDEELPDAERDENGVPIGKVCLSPAARHRRGNRFT